MDEKEKHDIKFYCWGWEEKNHNKKIGIKSFIVVINIYP